MSGLNRRESNHSVEQTVEKLVAVLRAKQITSFALIDHSGEAEKVGLQMRPTKLLVFGNPKAGTPLMNAAPSAAIDLPLKILVAEDEDGKVWMTYNSADYLQARHAVPPEFLKVLAVVETLVQGAAE